MKTAKEVSTRELIIKRSVPENMSATIQSIEISNIQWNVYPDNYVVIYKNKRYSINTDKLIELGILIEE